MRRLDLLPSAPLYPTASELRVATECVAPWALGLPEADEPNEWADRGKWCHSVVEAIAKGDTHTNAIGDLNEDWCYCFPWQEVERTLRRDALECKQDADGTWYVEQGIKWRSDGFDDYAELCDRQPGERARGWFAGTADLVYVREDGVLVVADWKFGPREAIAGEPARESCQGFFLALAFATLLGITGSSEAVVVARFERRMVREDGIEVDAYDITWGELCSFGEQLRGLANRIEKAVDVVPRLSAACGKCKARAECPAQMALETSVMAEVYGTNIEALVRPPQSPEDARALHFAIEQGGHLVAEWRKWRDAYILTNDPVPIGLGLSLKAVPQSRRAVVNTPEAMDVIEQVAGKQAIVVERSATCDSIKKAVREAAGKDITSTADRNKAKAKAEADAFDRLVVAGAVRESGTSYVVREVRTGEENE